MKVQKYVDSGNFLLNKYFLKLHCLFSENIHQIPTLNYLFLVPSRSTWVEMGVLGFLQLLKKKKISFVFSKVSLIFHHLLHFLTERLFSKLFVQRNFCSTFFLFISFFQFRSNERFRNCSYKYCTMPNDLFLGL